MAGNACSYRSRDQVNQPTWNTKLEQSGDQTPHLHSLILLLVVYQFANITSLTLLLESTSLVHINKFFGHIVTYIGKSYISLKQIQIFISCMQVF